jgi:hypothetical protein
MRREYFHRRQEAGRGGAAKKESGQNHLHKDLRINSRQAEAKGDGS